MPLTTVALLPHSPLLVPEIGRANHPILAKTTDAYREIGEALAAAETETIIIISPHGSPDPGAFVIGVAPEMEINFQDFGFIPPRTALNGDAWLADKIKNELRPDFPLQLHALETMDSGSAVPLYLLRPHIPRAKAIVLIPAIERNPEQQAAFGTRLGAILQGAEKNIGLIASGDLSHRLKKKSPGGYSPKGAKFDNRLIEYLNDAPTALANILDLEEKFIAEAGECGLKPLALALGALQDRPWEPEVLAYQTDFGIGYLSFRFNFPSAPAL